MNSYIVSLHTDSSRANNTSERLVVISWKTPKDETANPNYKKPPAVCISIPKIILTVTPSILNEAMTEAFHDLQNAVLRSLISDRPVSQRVGLSVNEEDISASAVASFLAGSTTNGRLSKEKLEQWFDTALTDPLTLLLANKMQIGDQPSADELARLETAVAQRRLFLTKIAGPGVPFNSTVNDQMIKMVELADDSITKRQVLTKLSSYTKQVAELEAFI